MSTFKIYFNFFFSKNFSIVLLFHCFMGHTHIRLTLENFWKKYFFPKYLFSKLMFSNFYFSKNFSILLLFYCFGEEYTHTHTHTHETTFMQIILPLEFCTLNRSVTSLYGDTTPRAGEPLANFLGDTSKIEWLSRQPM